MQHKKISVYFLSLLAIFMFFQNCTGSNIGSAILGSQNTNPTREYNQIGVIYRLGFFFHMATVPGQIGANAGSDLKGESCSHSILWLVSWGDSSIESAKKAGKINAVSSVEYQQLGILAGGLYHRFCTRVMGSATATTTAPAPTAIPVNQPRR